MNTFPLIAEKKYPNGLVEMVIYLNNTHFIEITKYLDDSVCTGFFDTVDTDLSLDVILEELKNDHFSIMKSKEEIESCKAILDSLGLFDLLTKDNDLIASQVREIETLNRKLDFYKAVSNKEKELADLITEERTEELREVIQEKDKQIKCLENLLKFYL